MFEQLLGDKIQLVSMQGQNFSGFGVSTVEYMANFPVDFFGRFFAAIALKAAVGARPHEERGGLALSTAGQANLLSHAKEANHLPGKSGGAFQVVLSASGDLMEDFFFGGAPAEGAADAIENLRTAHEELLAGGHLHGVAQGCPAA